MHVTLISVALLFRPFNYYASIIPSFTKQFYTLPNCSLNPLYRIVMPSYTLSISFCRAIFCSCQK